MRVFDCFPLFNEIDLLELRLNELWDVVDVFVIVEAKKTFTGKRKPMCLPDNEERLAKYIHKIRYVVVEDFPDGMSNWGKEEYQRNAIKKGLSDVLPDDILIFSDLDEIPRAMVVKSIVDARHKAQRSLLSFSGLVFLLSEHQDLGKVGAPRAPHDPC